MRYAISMNSDCRRIPHVVDCAVADAPWFQGGATVLVAVSGGADSMALFAALCERARHRRGLRIVAAHLDHHLREHSARDRDTVAAFADAHAVPMIAGDADVAAIARSARVSIETAGRRARYAFLQATAEREHAAWIATAHTRSDQTETILMRIVRGAGERGLAGIPAERGTIVRPLLDIDRADTADYCDTRGIPFVEDPSNADRRFARNVVRHDVLPALRRAWPGIDRALLASARAAADTLRRARRVTDPRLDDALAKDADGSWTLFADAFDGLDPASAAILLGDALARIGVHEDARTIHYDTMIAMACAPGLVGSSVDLPGAHVRRDHDALVFHPRSGGTSLVLAPRVEGTTLGVPGVAHAGTWTLRAEIVADNPFAADAPSHATTAAGVPGELVAYLAPGMGADAMTVRAPRPGDRIRPLGMTGHKKLSDVFVDRKVPYRERARTLVVEVAGEIVWIPGVATGESARVRPSHTSTLRLVARRDDGARP